MYPDLDRSLEGFEPNTMKLRQAIRFFRDKRSDAWQSADALQALLYFADFTHFEQYDTPITGALYRKMPNGPVAWDALPFLEFAATSPTVPEMSLFSETEREVLRQTAASHHGHDSEALNQLARAEAPWRAVGMHEQMPYYLAYYRNTYGEMELDEDELTVTWEPAEELAITP